MPQREQNKIHFHYLVKPFFFPNRTRLKQFLASQLSSHGKRIEAINFVFCDDAYLLEVNQEYLRHDNYTDIITFELSAPSQPLISDIFISVERVRENAREFSSSFQQELLRVIFHGCLHLVGFKDKKAEQAQQMRREEDAWLERYVPREMKSNEH